MIMFNDVLRDAGLDPARVQLVRHRDTRASAKIQPYDLWQSSRDDFELYQKIQDKRRFDINGHLASFLVSPKKKTVFCGAYFVRSVTIAPKGLIDPVGKFDVAGLNLYEIDHDPCLSNYEGRLEIDWGGSPISWVQRAFRQNKVVL